jgi:uncharacterized protein YndB with AHSA1/START domain
MVQIRFLFAASIMAAFSISPAPAAEPLVHSVDVNASLDEAWSAFTTKAGIESWMVPMADIDLNVGGKMRTNYHPNGQLGDENTIENAILSFEPRRMLSIKATKAPTNVPHADALQSMWTVIYFDALGARRTRVRVVGLGFGDDEPSRKLREFFDRGNAVTLKKLEERFADRATGAADAEALAAPLEPMRPFMGTWRGAFKGSTPEKPVADVMRFERALNGQAVKIAHSVNDGAYGGESFVLPAKDGAGLRFWYFTTSGFLTEGTGEIADGKWTSVEKVSGAASGITEVLSTTEILPDGRLHIKARYRRNGAWEDGHEIFYDRASDAKVIFR